MHPADEQIGSDEEPSYKAKVFPRVSSALTILF
jgi:hypothetical protein